MKNDYYLPKLREEWESIRIEGIAHYILALMLMGGLFLTTGFLFVAATAHFIDTVFLTLQPATSVAAFMLVTFNSIMGAVLYMGAGFIVGMFLGIWQAIALWNRYEIAYKDAGEERNSIAWVVKTVIEQIKQKGKKSYTVTQGALLVGIISTILFAFMFHAFSFPSAGNALIAMSAYFAIGAGLSYLDRKQNWQEMQKVSVRYHY